MESGVVGGVVHHLPPLASLGSPVLEPHLDTNINDYKSKQSSV